MRASRVKVRKSVGIDLDGSISLISLTSADRRPTVGGRKVGADCDFSSVHDLKGDKMRARIGQISIFVWRTQKIDSSFQVNWWDTETTHHLKMGVP